MRSRLDAVMEEVSLWDCIESSPRKYSMEFDLQVLKRQQEVEQGK